MVRNYQNIIFYKNLDLFYVSYSRFSDLTSRKLSKMFQKVCNENSIFMWETQEDEFLQHTFWGLL